jgi:hypothetical protein
MHGRANVNYGYAPSPYPSSPQPAYPQQAYAHAAYPQQGQQPQPAYPQQVHAYAAHAQQPQPAYPPPSYSPPPSYAPPSYAPNPASGTYPPSASYAYTPSVAPTVTASGVVPIAPRRADDSSWGRITLPPAIQVAPRGMPSFMALLLGVVAVGVALACDLVFLRVSVPFAGAYAWYMTTAFSFFSAGWATSRWTRAGRGLAIFVSVFSGIVYGCGDIALGVLVESLSRTGAIHLAAQGLAIAIVTGIAGAVRGRRTST